MLAATPYNENELLFQSAQGNEKAFRQLFDQYWNKVYAVAFTFTKSAVLSQEIVQDVFLKIWLKREDLTAIEKFDAYLFIIARNHIYNQLRKKATEPRFVAELEQHFLESSELPEYPLLLKETTQLVNKAVEQLPGQQKAVFRLSRNEGLAYNKIAEKLNISSLTVKSHMNRALHHIRQYLHAHTDELSLVAGLAVFFVPW